jgi:hypothetical protein
MVLTYNPAGLAELRGNQLLFDLNIAVGHQCVDPIGFYGWGAYGGGSPSKLTDVKTGESLLLNLGDGKPGPADQYYPGPLDTVCAKQNILPVPQLAYTARLTEDLGIGFGMMFPAVTPNGQWGDQNAIIHGAEGLRPAGTRYMLIHSGTIGMFPTVGVGYRLTHWLRIGASFEWGIIHVDNLNMATVAGGTSPHQDILARVRATDWFIPAVNASIHLVPMDALDIVAAVRFQGDLDAPGTIDLTTNVFEPLGIPHTTTNQVLGVHQKFPWKLRGGIRYADRLAPRPSGTGNGEANGLHGERIHDAFEDERWDIEADAEYQLNSRNQAQTIEYAQNQQVYFYRTDGSMSMANFPQASREGGTTDTVIQKHWTNQISLRVGGTYNVLPGLFAVSLGAHYENRGVEPNYMQIDYWPLSRVGLHAGVKFRVAHSIDLTASYAHIFQETLVVGAPPYDTGDNISAKYASTGVIEAIDKHSGVAPSRGEDPPLLIEQPPPRMDGSARLIQNTTQVSAGKPPWIINSGTYRSGFDVVAIGANVHF